MSFGAVAGAVVGGLVTNVLSDDGGGGIPQGQGYPPELREYYQAISDISREQFDIWKENALPLLQELATMTNVTDRTAEQESLAAQAVKAQYAVARQDLKRGAELSPGTVGSERYGALMRPIEMSEAGDVARAVTEARVREQDRLENLPFARKMDVASLYQGLPGQAVAGYTAAANAASRAGALDIAAARLGDERAASAAYGIGRFAQPIATRIGGAVDEWWRSQPTGTPITPSGGYSGTVPGYSGSFGSDSYAILPGGGYASPFRHGGAIRRRGYAEGGEVGETFTQLKPMEERQFQDWYRQYSTQNQLDPNPDDPRHAYDYRAWWLAMQRDPQRYNPQIDPEDGMMHGPSEFKLLGHPTMFKGGIDTRSGEPTASPFAEGGKVRGPGTGTSDSVPTAKRPGSYVLSADTVRALGTKKLTDLMDKAGVRPGMGEQPDGGQPVRLSKGEWVMPPEVTSYYGEDFFNKMQQKYHRPVMAAGAANGGAIRTRDLPHMVEEAIFRTIPNHALRRH